MQVKIAKTTDLENCLGKVLARAIMSQRSETMMRLPRNVTFVDSKPAFYLDDGSTLKAYAVDIETGLIENDMYCGSGGTTLNNANAQLSEGFEAPQSKALIFVESYWNGRNMSWNVTVVSKQVTKQIGVSK